MNPAMRALVLGLLLPRLLGCSKDDSADDAQLESTATGPGATVVTPSSQASATGPMLPLPAGPVGTPSGAPSPDAPSAPGSGSPAPTLNPGSTASSEPGGSGGGSIGGSGVGGCEVGGCGPVSNTGGGGVNSSAGTGGAMSPSGVGGSAVGGSGGSESGGQGGAEASEPGVQFIGRFVDDGAAGWRFGWSGSGVLAAFEGASVSVTLEDSGGNQFSVLIDGELRETLVAAAGSQSYELASGLGAGPHQVELYRRTEGSLGATTFRGFEFGAGGVLLPPPARKARWIEILGDSISCGYGNEGASATCGFSADTENHYLTYGALAARALDAEVTTIAWSGKGVVYNYGTDTVELLPELYERAVPTESGSAWSFAEAPDAVVINLGTNDFGTDGDPSEALFSERYVALLERLREVYPMAWILCTVGPMLTGADLEAARAGIESAVNTRQQAGDDAVAQWEMNIANDNPGCDYHPSVATHQAMADGLVTELRSGLGW